MTGCTPQETAEHIASSFIGGHDAVAGHEGTALHMVCNDTKRYILCSILFITAVCQLANLIHQGTVGVHIEEGSHILTNHSQSLKTHAGIDVLLDQVSIIALAVIVELREYDVPDLHVTVALAAHHILGTVAPLFAAVIIDLGAGTAGTCAVLPEVVLLAETVNPVCRNADFLMPYLEGLLIVQIDGRIETVCRNAHTLCQELPGKGNGLALEIVTEGKVAKHLKEGAVTSGLSDVFNVAGSNTLLAGGHTPSGRNFLSRKVGLQRSHTGIDQKQAVVIVRNQ